LKDIEYWNRYFNKIKDLIEQIPNYEQLNLFELYDEFTKRYDLKPTMDVFAVCRHYVNVRVYVRRIKAKVYDGKRERTIDEDGIHYLVRIDDKERRIIRKLLKRETCFHYIRQVSDYQRICLSMFTILTARYIEA